MMSMSGFLRPGRGGRQSPPNQFMRVPLRVIQTTSSQRPPRGSYSIAARQMQRVRMGFLSPMRFFQQIFAARMMRAPPVLMQLFGISLTLRMTGDRRSLVNTHHFARTAEKIIFDDPFTARAILYLNCVFFKGFRKRSFSSLHSSSHLRP